jgi:hypothetical protein
MGRPPKPAALRQRRNKKPGHATVTRGASPKGRIPELFDRSCPCGGAPEKPLPSAKKRRGRPPKARPQCKACLGTGILPWHPLTLAWWRDVWKSEVAVNYLNVDRHGLFRLAVLVDKFWRDSDSGFGVREIGAEIRLQQQAYGNTPLDRTRLQWEVEHPEPEKEPAEAEAPPVLDPRKVLRALA